MGIMVYSGPSSAQVHFEYKSVHQSIYRDIIDLKLDSAAQKLQELNSSDNLAAVHLGNYLDFFRLFITEDAALFKQFKSDKEKRLKSLDQLDDEDPYKRFAQAELKLHSALLRSKFGELVGASRELYGAYKLLRANAKAFPDFIYNKKSLSVIHTLVETVSLPGVIKKLFKIKGSLAQGISEIEEVIAHSYAHQDFMFKEEVDAIYIYILFYQANQKAKALEYLETSRIYPTVSPLSAFLSATIHQRAGNNDKALQILEGKPEVESQAAFPYLDLMEGVCRLRMGDASADQYLKSFLGDFKGRHYIKDAYQKLAWHALLYGEGLEEYDKKMTFAERRGEALVDADKQALKEATRNRNPNKILLKARLLYDGGYYTRAHTLLTINAQDFQNSSQHNMEFNYRMGRICQALKNYPEAMKYYGKTMIVENSSSYYTCNAALQSGLILESQAREGQALHYFRRCLEMDPEDYKSSLHQKAKTGIQRILE